MTEKHEEIGITALFASSQSANELLQAHQVVIDAWFDAWVRDQRARAKELLRKRNQSSGWTKPSQST
jgi:hypothetical protein